MKRALVQNVTLLRKPTQPVVLKKGLEIGRELFGFLDRWNKEHKSRKGIGLSANQLGIDASVCVLLVNNIRCVLVNPKILTLSDVKIRIEESCLSLPGVKVTTERSIFVEVAADNFGGHIQCFGVDLSRVTGKVYEKAILEAVCAQHEIGHLAGILITDIAC